MTYRCVLVPLLLATACGNGVDRHAIETNAADPVDPTAPPESPGAPPLAEPTPAPVAPEHSVPADLLRCELELRVHELGEAGDGEPSSPVFVGDELVVAYTRTSAAGSDLLVQRVPRDGDPRPARVVRSGVHAARPIVFGDGTHAFVLAVAPGGATEAVPLDPASRAVTLPHPPDGAALGPRGLVTTYTAGAHRIVHRPGHADVRLPPTRSFPEPREQILASGGSADLVVVHHGRAVSAAAVAGATVSRSPVLFTERTGTSWAESSVAASDDGFLLVRTGPAIADLEIRLADAAGVLGSPIVVPPPATASRPPGALVRRYPRAAALDDGWAVSYWDGTGPSMVRLDGAGRVVGDAIELRSGDERGGHTDARMVADHQTLGVTWQVAAPRMTHGFPEEEPNRPGPRLGVLRCAGSDR